MLTMLINRDADGLTNKKTHCSPPSHYHASPLTFQHLHVSTDHSPHVYHHLIATRTNPHTHSPTSAPSCQCSNPLIPSFITSLITLSSPSLNCSLIRPTHFFIPSTITHLFTPSFIHYLILPLAQSFTHSAVHIFEHFPTRPFTYTSLIQSTRHSPIQFPGNQNTLLHHSVIYSPNNSDH